MSKLCDLQIHINDEETFFLYESLISRYCGKLKKMLNGEKGRFYINDFPRGPYGFELVLKFCYNNGEISINASNVLILHSCALYLEMTEEIFSNNLLQQTQTFLDEIYNWKWNEIIASLKSCDCDEIFYTFANSFDFLEKVICVLITKLVKNSDLNFITSSSLSPLSSSESNFAKRLSFSTKVSPKITVPDWAEIQLASTVKSNFPNKAWWFEDLANLPPKIIEMFLKGIGAYKSDNKNLIVTRFLLYYMKKITSSCKSNSEYASLGETASYGVINVGDKNFSCRGLFCVLRIVSKFGISNDCRKEMEKLIGGMLEKATLDDLLVCGHDMGLYYDVSFVIRLIKLFVDINGNDVMKMKKVGGLIDKYLIEISPDQKLKISKFLEVAECLPDFARDCFDGVYRAIDIYLESHPMISFEESSRLCRCLNYNKLTFEVCKDLAKNPKIPPRIAMQALISQQINIPISCEFTIDESKSMSPSQINLCYQDNNDNFLEEKEDMSINLEKMQWRVSELEKLCKEMTVQMSKFTGHNV
ncbi:hypothetical protein P8452_06935 [Trifolium repens]|nr:hypothetical protein P8452_06935 [Trifolium repens]